MSSEEAVAGATKRTADAAGGSGGVAAEERKLDEDMLGDGASKIIWSTDGKEQFLLFFGGKKPCFVSNFYPSAFTLNGLTFGNVEQFFHFKKAEHFNDPEKAKQIREAKTAAEQKRLGRQVRNYNEKEWARVGPQYMSEGILAKFRQNDELRSQLLLTTNITLVEASPRDTKWGIGLGKGNPSAADRSKWRGKNLLGKVLMEARDAIAAEQD